MHQTTNLFMKGMILRDMQKSENLLNVKTKMNEQCGNIIRTSPHYCIFNHTLT